MQTQRTMEAMPQKPNETKTEEQSLLATIRDRLDVLVHLQRLALLGPDKVHRFVFEDKEVFFYLPDAAVDRIQHIILSRSTFFEAGLLSKVRSRIPPGSTILDVGANIGNHTVFFASFCDAKNVIAFEP